ncbi:hypothetical protein [Nitrospina watsonii]|uniref:Uncharacterized protein n=1 Tax=Nitrospina watsonii TaxID=1323948 RepID=A0ABM9HD31_9BACT|nr:hypothetical protein [Nitrospina watsonii]CAI2718079.1 conserved membrane protein of unknown function [Nitrospina watsonii]
MIEFLFVLYILIAFIFPLPVLSATLGAGTCYLLFRKHYLWKHQPASARRLLAAYWTCHFLNFSLSLGLAVVMALFIHHLIFKNYFLFIFNFLFCFFISYRWFDYTHSLFRLYLHKLRRNANTASSASGTLTLLIAFRPHSGLGLGMLPAFLDAGYLTLEENRIYFEGLLIQETWTPAHFSQLEKVSAEKLRLTPQPEHRHGGAAAYLLIVRDQFYPFRCRAVRDEIQEILQPETEAIEAPLPTVSAPRWRSAG